MLIVGAASTEMLSSAAVPLDAAVGPITVKPSTGMLLIFKPMLVPVMVATTVQDPLAGIMPAENDTVDPLAALVPTHVPAGADAFRPDGKLSVNAAPVMDTLVGLLKVIVSVVVPFSGVVFALNDLLILGRATFNVAFAAAAFAPMLDVTLPAAMVLI